MWEAPSSWKKREQREQNAKKDGGLYGEVSTEEYNELVRNRDDREVEILWGGVERNKERIIDDIRLAEYVREHHPDIVLKNIKRLVDESDWRSGIVRGKVLPMYVDRVGDIESAAREAMDIVTDDDVTIELKFNAYTWVFNSEGFGLQKGESFEEALESFLRTIDPHRDLQGS